MTTSSREADPGPAPSAPTHDRVSRRRLLRSMMPAIAVAAVPLAHAPASTARAPLNPRDRAASIDDDSITGPVDSVDPVRSTLTLGTAVGGQAVVHCDADTAIWSDTFITLDQLRRYQMVVATGRVVDGAFHASVIEAIYRGVEVNIDSVDGSGVLSTDAGLIVVTQYTRDEATDRQLSLAAVKTRRRMRALVRDDPLSGTMVAFRMLG